MDRKLLIALKKLRFSLAFISSMKTVYETSFVVRCLLKSFEKIEEGDCGAAGQFEQHATGMAVEVVYLKEREGTDKMGLSWADGTIRH